MAIAVAHGPYVVRSAAKDTSTLTTSSFTPTVGEVIMVCYMQETNDSTYATPSDTQGNTYTKRSGPASPAEDGSAYGVVVWYSTIATAATAMTVSVAGPAGARFHSLTVWGLSGAQLASTPATARAAVTTSGAPNLSITTTAANSLVLVGVDDWNAGAFTSRAFQGTVTEATGSPFTETGGAGTFYLYQQSVAVAGATNVGMTAPNMRYMIAAIEVQEAAAGGGSGGTITRTRSLVIG